MGRKEEFSTGGTPHVYARGSIRRRLPATMTPNEIVSQYRSGDLRHRDKAEQDSLGEERGGLKWLMDISYQGAHGRWNGASTSLAESIQEKGYDPQYPIVLNPNHSQGPTIIDGHHRLAVMLKTAPDTPIPVMFTDDEMYNRTIEDEPEKFTKRKLMEPKPRPNIYAGNCKACGQKVPEGEGVLIKVQGRGNPFHLYHPHHLTSKQRTLYPKYKSRKQTTDGS